MGVFYFMAGLMGNLFGVCVDFQVSVGNMAAVMGLVSGMLGSVIVNWKVLAGAGYMRICLIFMMVFLIVILLILSASKPAPDGIGDWEAISLASMGGGCMAGLGLGMMLMPYSAQRDSPYVKMIRYIGFAMTFVLLVILIPVFFASVEPTPTFWSIGYF